MFTSIKPIANAEADHQANEPRANHTGGNLLRPPHLIKNRTTKA
jgi:hypothetical protein